MLIKNLEKPLKTKGADKFANMFSLTEIRVLTFMYIQTIWNKFHCIAMLDFVLTIKEGLMGNVKLKGSLGCSDHEIVDFKILRAAKRVQSKLATLNFRRADFLLRRILISRIAWDKALEGRGAKESWLIFKDHLLRPRE